MSRLYRRWEMSLDDVPLSIHCPDVLSQEEFAEVRDFVNLFLRQLERWSIKPEVKG